MFIPRPSTTSAMRSPGVFRPAPAPAPAPETPPSVLGSGRTMIPSTFGPKLVFRTSKDVFTLPTGPEHDPRVIQLLSVHDHNKLGQDNLWVTIREEVRDLLEA